MSTIYYTGNVALDLSVHQQQNESLFQLIPAEPPSYMRRSHSVEALGPHPLSPDIVSPTLSEFTSEHPTPRSSVNSPSMTDDTVDHNGRRRRIYTKTQFSCNHCSRKFSIKYMDEYARHVEEFSIEREFKCPEPSCPWSKIGFQRKLEKDRHFTRKHGVPKYECRFWAGPGKEKFAGANVCTTQWHADSGNRTRHEKNVHGYFVKTHRGRASSLEEVEMIKVPRRRKLNSRT
ncbi:uncharacterized protein V2V93DRAFT_391877 [Kockiozyma suomiensis]|uniref:uncharacterized protein n=1 Tax=Kockiozyma suomiensis TaxID=1337062 RepID=UPI003343C310